MDSPVFILSTGRTGTQFFKDYINGTPGNAFCRHEPVPSRRFKFLSNLYLNGKVSSKFIVQTYIHSRKRLFQRNQGLAYIESSNFMFGCIPSLNTHYENIRIIHIVRNPVDYVKSHLNHGFWRGHKRLFARYIPYWLEKIEVGNSSDPVDLLSSRWNYVNRQIQTYSGSNKYLRVKFEELFSGNVNRSSSELNRIRNFCDLPELEEAENARWLNKPMNRSKVNISLKPEERDFILRNTEALMKEYGYLNPKNRP